MVQLQDYEGISGEELQEYYEKHVDVGESVFARILAHCSRDEV